ncbi:hypothetical protein ACFC5Z_09980 [Streptomyces sp. NPDC056004]|uniref:hypothetical protein n=1 Tax=unclassified Streptomyces TaxID=2593676 RepID=UPI0035E19B0A
MIASVSPTQPESVCNAMRLKNVTARVIEPLATALVVLAAFQAPAALAVPGPAGTIKNLKTNWTDCPA